MRPPIYQVETPDEVSGAVGEIAVLDHGSLARGAWDIGQSGAASGRAVIEWIRLAEQLARNGEIDGWIMAPVDSQSLKASGEISSIDDLQPTGTSLLRVSPTLRIVPNPERKSVGEGKRVAVR